MPEDLAEASRFVDRPRWLSWVSSSVNDSKAFKGESVNDQDIVQSDRNTLYTFDW